MAVFRALGGIPSSHLEHLDDLDIPLVPGKDQHSVVPYVQEPVFSLDPHSKQLMAGL